MWCGMVLPIMVMLASVLVSAGDVVVIRLDGAFAIDLGRHLAYIVGGQYPRPEDFSPCPPTLVDSFR
jgi:hypothetical protein